MSAFSHSRTPSEESTGSSYQLILEHLMQYPGSYEIPLRTMYTLNCVPRAQPLPNQLSRAGTPVTNSVASSPTSPTFPPDASSAAAQFTASLMHQISKLPSQPCSLPPSFIISFVSRCFTPDLTMVDFPQALTALDYLKDLEIRRRKEVASALNRLDISPNTVGTEADDISRKYPGVAQWVRNIETKERKIDALYTQLYIGLRRWILINELSLTPFNHHNCLAMLNTLYPPVISSQPTSVLTVDVLKRQRDGFFKYIKSVQKAGPHVLRTLMDQGKLEHEENGWAAVHRTLDSYLATAKNIMDDCVEISSPESFAPVEQFGKRKGRKVDSGVSFKTVKRPSTSGSSTSICKDKPLPPEPEDVRAAFKGLSTLEKITREFKRLRLRKQIEVEEIIPQTKKEAQGEIIPEANTEVQEERPNVPMKPKSKSLKKMRSLGALGHLKHGNFSSASLSVRKELSDPEFNVEEMRQHRNRFESRYNTWSPRPV